MHGPLSEIGLADVLQLLERGRRSGVLVLSAPDRGILRRLEIVEGRISSVEPEADDEAIRQVLLQRSLTSSAGWTAAPTVVEQIRQEIALRTLSEMLEWQHGDFDFTEMTLGPGRLDISVATLLREVVSREALRAELGERLESFLAVPDFVDAAPEPPWPEMDSLTWLVLDAVDGVRSIAAIASRLAVPVEDVAQRIDLCLAETILVLRSTAARVDIEARAAVAAGRYQMAVEHLQSRVAAVPDDEEAWRLLGLAQVGIGRFDLAVKAWQSWQALAGPRTQEAAQLLAAARTMLEAMREHHE